MDKSIESFKYEIEREIQSLDNTPGTDLENRREQETLDYGFSLTDKISESSKAIDEDFKELQELAQNIYDNAKERYSLLNTNFTDEEINQIKNSEKSEEIIKKLISADAVDISFKLSKVVSLLRKATVSLTNAKHYYELLAQSDFDIIINKNDLEGALTNHFILEREILKSVMLYRLEHNMDISHEKEDLEYYKYIAKKTENLSVIEKDRFDADKDYHQELLWEWTNAYFKDKDA